MPNKRHLRRKSAYRPAKERVARRDALLASLPDGIPRPEYPRPNFMRREWQCLNGSWSFTFDPEDRGLLERWQDQPDFPDFIVVPFAPQTKMSCKNDKDIYTVAWYARRFNVPAQWHGRNERVLLHFGAVDYQTTLWINGEEVGHNQGGHVPFSFDITAYLTPRGSNQLVLRVEDSQDNRQPRGKQSATGVPRSCDYYCTTGIWQTVWMEPVPVTRLQDVQITPLCGADPSDDALEVRVNLHAPAIEWDIEIDVLDGFDEADAHADRPIVTRVCAHAPHACARLSIPLPHGRRWSPEDPYLYGLRVRVLQDGRLVDQIESYAGLRSVTLKHGLVHLNGNPVYLKMVLDQGYWPESGMTAPSDAALRADVAWVQAFGYNGVRKHQKVEDPRWLYWCDTMGLLVWSEMANARSWSPKAEEMFLAEWERAVRRDYNHPCIIAWVPLNESWGVPNLIDGHPAQYAFMERVVALTRRLDSERPVISNDGWEQADVTDILGIHDYTGTKAAMLKRYQKTIEGGPLPTMAGTSNRSIFAEGALYRGQPIMLTEIGGILYRPTTLPREKWDDLYKYYASCVNAEDLRTKYEQLMEALSSLTFLGGFCYTQLTDIELEINGLMTYDRQPKIDPAAVKAIHDVCFDPKILETVVRWHTGK